MAYFMYRYLDVVNSAQVDNRRRTGMETGQKGKQHCHAMALSRYDRHCIHPRIVGGPELRLDK
jgi:hypothetical protein